jgi:hypothetical protein
LPAGSAGFPGTDPAGLAGEHEEGRLEGVFGVVGAGGDAAADGQNRRAVAADEFGERLPVPAGDEPGEQVGVGREGEPGEPGGEGGHP